MYEFISGKLDTVKPDYVIVDCNGVGYKIYSSVNTYHELVDKKIGQHVTLYTYAILKDELFKMYGFLTTVERDLFLKLLSINKIGFKIAFSIMNSLSISEFVDAVGREDVNRLAKVNGVGAKTAERLVFEFRSFIDSIGLAFFTGTDSNSKQSKANDQPSIINDVVSALQNFGYKLSDVKPLAESAYTVEDTVETLLRKVLVALKR